MYELSVMWSGDFRLSCPSTRGTSSRAHDDGLPYYGPHRNYPRHYSRSAGNRWSWPRRSPPRESCAVIIRARPTKVTSRSVHARYANERARSARFGPHPDDLEIGLGGTLAKHAALGHSVGLCDLTRGEMGSNGTPDERVKEAERARGAGRGVAREPRAARPAMGRSADHVGVVVELIRACVRARLPFRTGRIAIPITGGGRRVARGRVQRAAPAICRRRRSVAARMDLLLLHQRRAPPSFVVECPSTTMSNARRWRATAASSRRSRDAVRRG